VAADNRPDGRSKHYKAEQTVAQLRERTGRAAVAVESAGSIFD
jgi:hypothetical protein